MLAAVTASASHPAVATLLGLGAAAVAGVIVAMAWNVHARQIRLAEQLSRRQPIVTAAAAAAGRGGDAGGAEVAVEEMEGVAKAAAPATPPVVIEGPGTVVTGEQASYRMRPAAGRTVISWAVGGGSVSQAPDPAHPGELLLIANEPGRLTITAQVRDGLTERSGTKSVTATAGAAAAAPPFMVRLFLQGWGLVVVAVLIVGFAGALGALGSFASSDFVALVSSLAALLGVVTVTRGTDSDSGRSSKGPAGRGL
jgi:hypothetical protein